MRNSPPAFARDFISGSTHDFPAGASPRTQELMISPPLPANLAQQPTSGALGAQQPAYGCKPLDEHPTALRHTGHDTVRAHQ